MRLNRDQSTSLGTVARNGAQLLKLIDQILDISKVEADRLEVEAVETDLRALLLDVRALFAQQARDTGIALEVRCASPVPAKLFTDPTRLRQVLTNVIGNAIKFTSKGYVKVHVSWLRGDPLGRLQVCIEDTGVGIAPEQAARLFHPFVQADSSTTRQFGGTGLGLALSRRIAEALGGLVRLDASCPGAGSTFVVEIEAACAHDRAFLTDLDAVRAVSVGGAVGGAVVADGGGDCLLGTRVLVVDDAADNRTLMKRFLTAAGAHVDSACDGFGGVEKALGASYHVVLMDVQMPKMDGHAATTFLRTRGYRGRIIALTAHALKEERELSLKAGCDDHLTKPIDRRTLILEVARHARESEREGAGSRLMTPSEAGR